MKEIITNGWFGYGYLSAAAVTNPLCLAAQLRIMPALDLN